MSSASWHYLHTILTYFDISWRYDRVPCPCPCKQWHVKGFWDNARRCASMEELWRYVCVYSILVQTWLNMYMCVYMYIYIYIWYTIIIHDAYVQLYTMILCNLKWLLKWARQFLGGHSYWSSGLDLSAQVTNRWQTDFGGSCGSWASSKSCVQAKMLPKRGRWQPQADRH